MFFFALIVKSQCFFFDFKKNILPPRYFCKALCCCFFCRVGFPYIYPHCLGAVSILPKRMQLSVHTFDRYRGPHEVGDYLPMCLSQSASTSSNLMIGFYSDEWDKMAKNLCNRHIFLLFTYPKRQHLF